MSEELLKELLEETKKQNKIQEEIKREMELQNDLMIFFVENAKEIVSTYRYGHVGRKLAKGRLYARLNDEDKSIIERNRDYKENEAEIYHRVTGGCDLEFMMTEHHSFKELVKSIQVEILNDVYTEKELYEFFVRVFKRGGLSKRNLDSVWEEGWQETERSLVEEYEEQGVYDENSRKIREMYENRITKNMVK